jgi:hypothetical protein
MDQNTVMEFLGRFVSDMGATGSAGGVVIGHRLGLYRSLAEGPATPTGSPTAPGATPGTSPSGCADRPPAGT